MSDGPVNMRSTPTTHPRFARAQPRPALAAQAGTLDAGSVTTPDFPVIGTAIYCYVGAVRDGHERILVLEVPAAALRPPVALNALPARLAVDVGPAGGFDSEHVMDPAGVVVGGRVFLYYSALGSGPDSIGLATSEDGVAFVKHAGRICFGRAPEVIYHQGRFFLFYVRPTPTGGYAIHLATSTDGISFQEVDPQPVLSTGDKGLWDAFSVTTPRLFARGDFFYMLYAGDDETRDEPKAFGLARSHDLVRWARYPHNPVFRRGQVGSWDDGAIWSGTVFAWGNSLYLFYEGTSRPALRSGANISAVGLAFCPAGEFDRHIVDWSGEWIPAASTP